MAGSIFMALSVLLRLGSSSPSIANPLLRISSLAGAKEDILKSGFAMLGLENPNLNNTLSAMKIEPAIIANLTSSFADPSKLLEAFTQPEKLTALLQEHTGMDEATITGFVDTVKSTFKSDSGEPGSAVTSQPASLVYWLAMALVMARGGGVTLG